MITFKELFDAIKKHNIPTDTRIVADTGWEMGYNDLSNAYYDKRMSTIILASAYCANIKDYNDDHNLLVLIKKE